jgi:hypothetical protein
LRSEKTEALVAQEAISRRWSISCNNDARVVDAKVPAMTGEAETRLPSWLQRLVMVTPGSLARRMFSAEALQCD